MFSPRFSRIDDAQYTCNSSLYINYPQEKPPEYARQGLYYHKENDEGRLDWKTQIIPLSYEHTLGFLFNPPPILSVGWGTVTTGYDLMVAKIKNKIGWSLTREQNIAQHIDRQLSATAKKRRIIEDEERRDAVSSNKLSIPCWKS